MAGLFATETLSCGLQACWDGVISQAGYAERQKACDEFNNANRWRKRGLAVIPTKFGISFTTKFLNQAGALVHIYTDGTVLVTHGGVEMGQGLHTKVAQVRHSAYHCAALLCPALPLFGPVPCPCFARLALPWPCSCNKANHLPKRKACLLSFAPKDSLRARLLSDEVRYSRTHLASKMHNFKHLLGPATILQQPKVSDCTCSCIASNPVQLAQCGSKLAAVIQHSIQSETHDSGQQPMSEAHVDYRWRQLIWESLCPVSTSQRLPPTRSPTALLLLPLPAATCMAQPRQTPVPSSTPASSPTGRSAPTPPSSSLSTLLTLTGLTSQRMASMRHLTSQVCLPPV